MRRASIALILALSATSYAYANQPTAADAKTEAPLELDTMKACYVGDKSYSEGFIVQVGDRALKCVRKKSEYGHRSDALPLEWAEL